MVSFIISFVDCANSFFSYDLPDDVFDKEKGDVKPVKPPKKKVPVPKKPVHSTVQKRSFSDIEVGDFLMVYDMG